MIRVNQKQKSLSSDRSLWMNSGSYDDDDDVNWTQHIYRCMIHIYIFNDNFRWWWFVLMLIFVEKKKKKKMIYSSRWPGHHHQLYICCWMTMTELVFFAALLLLLLLIIEIWFSSFFIISYVIPALTHTQRQSIQKTMAIDDDQRCSMDTTIDRYWW